MKQSITEAPKNPTAFSLPEVTISLGIVAVVILPTLALLASGGRLHQLSVDRDKAAVITESILSDFKTSLQPEHFTLSLSADTPPLEIPIPAVDSSEIVWLTADTEGTLTSSIPESEFLSGAPKVTEALYAVRIGITRKKGLHGIPNAEILEVVIETQSPARAPEASREKVSIVTLKSLP